MVTPRHILPYHFDAGKTPGGCLDNRGGKEHAMKPQSNPQETSLEYQEAYIDCMCLYLTDSFELTRSEGKVFWLVANGMSRKEIAERLHVSIDTVGTHLKNVYRKLGVHSLLSAVKKVIEYRS